MKNSDPVSQRQKKYLLDIRRNSILIQVSRDTSVCIFCRTLGNLCQNRTDRFLYLFQARGRSLEKMWEMLLDHTLIDHVSITLLETLISFALVTVLGIGCGVAPLGFSTAVPYSGTLSGSFKQPAQIRPGSFAYRMAGQQYEDHCPWQGSPWLFSGPL